MPILVLILGLFSTCLLADNTLRTDWAIAHYDTPSKKQLITLEKLMRDAEKLSAENPDDPEVLLWYAIIVNTYADVKGTPALSYKKRAKNLLEQTVALDPTIENGLAESVLGYLYARTPSWPIAFGNKQKAYFHLEKGIEIDPEGIDSNYYYGDFLIDVGEYDKARVHLKIAKKAPIRPDHQLQDEGRKEEIKNSLKKLKKLRH
jgi:tetratricopeptide (TPR) repeat protein